MEKTPETPKETVDTAEEAHPEGPNHSGPETPGDAPRAKKVKMHVTAEMKADPVSKKLILLSFTFASFAVLCVGGLAYLHYQKKHAHAPAPVEVEEKLPPVINQAVTEIEVKLKNEQDLRAEIVAECSDRETCNFIKEHMDQVRDLLIPILSSIDPESFSTIENKKLVRKKLTDRLNTIEELPGKVVQVQFNNLSIDQP